MSPVSHLPRLFIISYRAHHLREEVYPGVGGHLISGTQFRQCYLIVTITTNIMISNSFSKKQKLYQFIKKKLTQNSTGKWFFFVGTAGSAFSKDRSVLIFTLKRSKNGFVNFPSSSNGRDEKIVKYTTGVKSVTPLQLLVQLF